MSFRGRCLCSGCSTLRMTWRPGPGCPKRRASALDGLREDVSVDQRAVIEVALAGLSLRWNVAFTALGVPDEIERQLPAVDLLVEDAKGHKLVIEHTIVESFSGRIFEDTMFAELAKCLEDRLTGRLPVPGHYRVTLEPGGLRRRDSLEAVCADVVEWAESQASSLALGSPLTAPDHIATGVLAPWGLKVRLGRWPRHDGRVVAMRATPSDLEEMRADRVTKALAAKCPKLKRAAEGGRTSILVLESDDLALGNYSDVANATASGLGGRPDQPDVVVLVETEIDADVWLIKEHGSVFPDITAPGPLPLRTA